MRVAITGGTGFLGKIVYFKLLAMGYQTAVLTRSSSENNNYIITDYTTNSLKEALKGFDAVVHLAAKRSNDKLIANYKENETVTQNIYEACVYNEINNIVYASTISVYSDITCLPWNEELLPDPVSIYGISKLSGEYLGNYYSRNYNLNVKNLRLAHLYGFNEINNYMINLFIRQAFNQLTLTLNTPSKAKREFLYVKDAAKAIELALRESTLCGNFNIGSGEALTNYEVAKKINECFHNEGNLIIKDNAASETINSSYMDNKKAELKLKFTPDYSFDKALEEIKGLMKGLDNVPIYY
ncbi:NAD-dependent epimerase/dehydratase family protein [Shouchella clausii]|uniref:UDP-N-acetylglucosamine 4-epimerase n=1 Tax=Shouchella clausii TaxID=79880 RepID=A0A268NZV6_SHOCL|nr:NAD(P)-dependent oxidoreductase [Shouchella clausii]PAE89032.1 UDP-N-acetylglucosamine 4-epimerase [Shouchella clausii]